MNSWPRALRIAGSRLAVPAGAGIALSLWLAPRPLSAADPEAALGAALWLHLPAFLIAASALALALELWPLATRERPGAEWLTRLRQGPLDGCGPVFLGVAMAAALWLAGTGALFAWLLQARGEPLRRARIEVGFTTPEPAWLDSLRREVVLHGASDAPIETLILRPLAFLPPSRDLLPARCRVLADGVPLHGGELTVAGSRDSIQLTFPPRQVRALTIERTSQDGYALGFDAGAVLGLSATTRHPCANAALAAGSYLLPLGLALLVALALRRIAALPIALGAALAVLLGAVLFDWTSQGQAIASCARGVCVAPLQTLTGTVPSFSPAVLAMIFSMRRRRRTSA